MTKQEEEKNERIYSIYDAVIKSSALGDISLNNCLCIKFLLGGQEAVRPKYRDLIMSEEEFERQDSLGLIPSVEDIMNGHYIREEDE